MSKKKRTGLEFDTSPILNFYKKIIDGFLWKFFNFGCQILLVFVGIAYVSRAVFRACLKRLSPSVVYWYHAALRFVRWIKGGVVTPVLLLGKCFVFAGSSIKNARGFRKFTAVFKDSGAVIRKNPKPLFTLFNHIIPLAAVACMIFVIVSTATTTYAVEITCDNNLVGIVKDEKVFQSANTMMLQRIVETDQKIELSPSFRLVRSTPGNILTTDELTDELIKNTNIEIGNAYGLYIDGTFIKATPEVESIQQELDAIIEKYSTPDDPDAKISFIADVNVIEGLYVKSSIVSDSTMRSIIRSDKQGNVTYTVQSGDTIDKIASSNGISKSSLFAANPGFTENSTIYPGQTLSLSAAVPFLDVQTTRTIVYEQEVQYSINTTTDGSMLEGTVKITRAGQRGVNRVTDDVVYINGAEISRKRIDTETLKLPVAEDRIVGTMTAKELADRVNTGPSSARGVFIWPANGGYTSQGYRSGHRAMDIAGISMGTSTYASASGTVIIAGWYYDYGQTVIIDHNNGFKTLYAHHSSLNVKVGQHVNQGDVIGGAGRTGRSTGVHLHFEIIYNGQQLNPASLIGTRGR